MAWLVAFNDGLFDGLEGLAIYTKLDKLLQRAATESPAMSVGPEAWRIAVAGWLQEKGDEPAA